MTSERQLGIAGLVRQIVDSAMLSARVAQPGRVEAYYPERQTADVQPLFRATYRRPDGSSLTEDLPLLPEVPVCWPQWGGWVIDGELAKGDLVLLVFADRALDRWAADPVSTNDPGSPRSHDLSDALALPALGAGRSQASAEAPLRLRRLGTATSIVLEPSGAISLNAGGEATEPLVRGSALETWLTTQLSVSTAFGPSGPAIAGFSAGVLSELAKVR